jgi:hypothetical protein
MARCRRAAGIGGGAGRISAASAGSCGHRHRTSGPARSARRRSRCSQADRHSTGTMRTPPARQPPVQRGCSRARGQAVAVSARFTGAAGDADMQRDGHAPFLRSGGGWGRHGTGGGVAHRPSPGRNTPSAGQSCAGRSPGLRIQAFANGRPTFPALRASGLGRPFRSRSRGRLRFQAFACRIPSSPVIGQEPAQPQPRPAPTCQAKE